MSGRTDFETELRRHLDGATEGLHAGTGFWSEVERRGHRRLRRRRVAAGSGASVAVAAVVAVAVALSSPNAVPVIEPAAPGDVDWSSSILPAESETEGEANEASGARDIALEPITGYGDFSGADPFEIDPYATTRLVAQCLLDAGFDVALVPPGDGIVFNDAERQPAGLAEATADACHAGLNLPEPRPLSEEQSRIVYEYQLAVRHCLTDEGLDLPPPASFGQFSTVKSWSAYDGVMEALAADAAGGAYPLEGWDEIQMRCPQSPVGGLGSWAPGDPVQPVHRLPVLRR